jgi:ribosomal protein S28E/S33
MVEEPSHLNLVRRQVTIHLLVNVLAQVAFRKLEDKEKMRRIVHNVHKPVYHRVADYVLGSSLQ